jgi:hypothetical protein
MGVVGLIRNATRVTHTLRTSLWNAFMTISLASRRPRARYAALLIVLPLLAGCSPAASGAHSPASAAKSSTSASSGSGSTSKLGPCDYLSATDASAVYGVTLTSAEADGACSYTGAQATGFATTVTGGLTGAGDPVWKNEVKSLDGATKLSGVGDEAYGSAGAIEVKIVVRAGNTLIEVADADGSDTTTFPKSIAIAKAIIAKLG